MVFEKIIGSLDQSHKGKEVITLPYEWYESTNKILKKTASSGERIGLRISQPLFDGAIVYEDEGKVIALELLPCEVTNTHVQSMREMGRVCFELGNRHCPLSVSETAVKTPYDSATFEYLQKKGFECEKVYEKFIPEFTVKGHGHHSDSDYVHHLTGISATGHHHHGGGFAH